MKKWESDFHKKGAAVRCGAFLEKIYKILMKIHVKTTKC